MGNSSFWFTFKNGPQMKNNINNSKNVYKMKDQNHTKSKTDLILESKIKYLLEKYKDNFSVKEDILSKLSMYELNRTIATDMGDMKTFKCLTKEFNDYLNEL